MPVKLFTGLPGAGKTACLVAELIRLKEAEPERPVYQIGINGLADGIAERLTPEQLEMWWELPPGAIIAIDEAQEEGLMPLDQGKPAEWVKRISKVRHEGMDFLLTTQHPAMLSSYIRRLVDQHVHAVRKFNTQVVERYTWGRCMDACEKGSAQRGAVVTIGTLPKEVFDLYKSSNAHNMKRRIPKKVFLLPLLALVAVTAIVSLPVLLRRMQRQTQQAAAPLGAKGSATASVDMSLRATNYVKWMTPRVQGLPWTAPAYDGLPVRSNPRVFCIAVEDGSTHCVSEQGTDVDVPPGLARQIAAHGVYDPFLDESANRNRSDDLNRDERRRMSAPGPAQPAAPTLPPITGAGAGGRGIHEAYIPPTMGAWNPEG